MRHIKFCPKCRSLNVRSRLLGFLGFPAKYRCKDCGYQAFIFPAISIEELKKIARKK
jgi:transposase-like protein